MPLGMGIRKQIESSPTKTQREILPDAMQGLPPRATHKKEQRSKTNTVNHSKPTQADIKKKNREGRETKDVGTETTLISRNTPFVYV